MVRFLEKWLDVPLNEENEENFKRELRELLSPLVMGAHDGKREIGYRALNNRLEELGLPYVIVKEIDRICVKKMEEKL